MWFINRKNNNNPFDQNKFLSNPEDILDQFKQNLQIIKYRYRDFDLFINNDNAAEYHINNSTQKIEKLVESCFLSEFGKVLDIGANVGLFSTFYLIKNPGATCYLFEPDDQLHEVIHLNLKGKGEYTLFENIVSSTSKEMDIYINSISRQTNSVSIENVIPYAQLNTIETLKRNSITIDEFVNRQNLDEIQVLKLDIQGHEYDALIGAFQVLKNIKEVIVEVAFDIGKPLKVIKLLDDNFSHFELLDSVQNGFDFRFFNR